MTRTAGALAGGGRRHQMIWACAWLACACASSRRAESGPAHAPEATPSSGGISASLPGLPIPDDVARLEGEALAAERGGHAEEALALRGSAVCAAEAAGRPRLAAVLLNRMGALLEATNRVQDALDAYESGLRALERAQDVDLGPLLAALRRTRKVYPRQRYVPVPVDLYPEVFDPDLARAENDPARVVRLLANAGSAYARQPQLEVALDRYEHALDRPEMAQVPDVRARVLANAGEIRRRLSRLRPPEERRGEIERARSDLAAARRWLEANARPVERRRLLTSFARLEYDRGELAEAEATYGAALRLYVRAGDSRGEGRALVGRGRVRLQRGAWEQAREDFANAVGRGLEHEDRELLWQAYWGLGVAERHAGRLDGATRSLGKALELVDALRGALATDEGKVTFVEGTRGVVDDLVEVHLDRAARGLRGAWGDVLAVAEEARARALQALMSRGAWRSERDPPGAPRFPAHCSGRSGESPSRSMELAPGLPSPQVAMGGARFEICPGVWSPPRPDGSLVPPRRTPSAAGAANALSRLVFHVTPAHAVVLAVDRAGAVTGAVIPLGEADLQKRVEDLRAALGVTLSSRGVVSLGPPGIEGSPAGAPAEALLAALYRDLVEPIAGGLPRRDEPLVIEPDGVLWLLPFAALRAPDGEAMVDRWPLLYAPSAAVLDEIRASPGPTGPAASRRALIVGNPLDTTVSAREGDLWFTFRALPGAAQEAAAVAGLFTQTPPDVRIGPGAGLAGIVEHIQDFGVIHLATHGVTLADDPLSSFLVLADSYCGRFLTAREITGLNVEADLVVLSACQTGLGQVGGDGVIGLGRSFLVAGARSVIVSLWNVDDRRTADLMLAFYEGYVTAGADKASALRSAMRAVRDRSGANPRVWAPFLLVGAER